MHRCFLFPVALTFQLVVCFCCGVAAFPSAGRPVTFAISPSSPDSSLSSSSSEEQLVQSLQYRPRLLTLLRLGLLSSPVDKQDSSSEAESEEEDLDLPPPLETAKREYQVKHKKMSLDRGEGPPRLSIVNPLDVLRQKMLLEILRVKNETTQRIVDENAKVMERLGKRNAHDMPNPDRSIVRPNRQRLSQMLSTLVATV